MGMWLWAAACLGWLLGVALQWQSQHLAPPGWHVAAMGVGAGVSVWALLADMGWLARARWRQLRSLPRAALVLTVPMAAGLLGWGSTGWRAAQLLQQRWPEQLQRTDVGAVVKLEGLPQAMPAMPTKQPAQGGCTRWRLDATVQAWEGVQASPGTTLPERITFYADWRWPEPPMAGQRWHVKLRLHPPDGLSNPGVHSGTLSAFGRGVRAVGQLRPGADSLQPLPDIESLGALDRIDRWRQRIREAIVQRVPEAREAGVLAGLSVGDQAAIAPADWDVLRRTGVAHLVSISGAHVAMLGCLCAALTRRCWARSRRLSLWLSAPTAALWVAVLGAAAYTLMSGGGVPAQRTVWTLALMSALRTVGRAWPWPLVWLLCATIVTACDPVALMQAGFWLSFVAVAVLMSAGDAPREMALATRDKAGGKQGTAAAASASAVTEPGALARMFSWLRDEAMSLWRTQRLVSLALMPLSLVCFQQVSLIGLVANLVAVPLFGAFITPLALMGAACPWAWDVAAACTRLAFGGLQWLSAWPMAVWATPSAPMWLALAAVLASFALAVPGPWRWRSLALPFLLPLLYLPEPWRVLPQPAPGQFSVIAMDVGQGTAVLVRTARHQLLFDTGASMPAGGDMGARVVLPVLQALGVRSLDALVISHQDNDHVGGAQSVVQGLPVALLRSSLPDDHPLLQGQADAGRVAPPMPHQACVAGQIWLWDGVRFDVLHPTQDDLDERQALPTNALSCVLRVQADHGGASLLLTGDIEAPQEQAMLARTEPQALRSTVLVVPHHGSNTSSTPAFLAAVQPEVAVIQAGRRNRYGHPSPGIVNRYATLGVHTDTTPSCGAWLWQSDGDWGQGRCWRELSRRVWDDAPQVPQ